jgi:hypothetical protein
MKPRICAVATLAMLLLHGASAAPVVAGQEEPAIRALFDRLEQAVRAGDPAAYLALLSSSADRTRATDFATSEIRPGATQVLIKERTRAPAAEAQPESGYRIVMDTFVEFRDRARIATWHLDVRKSSDDVWGIANQARLSAVNDLYRLSVNPSRQLVARDFTIKAEDLDLTLTEGSVFTVDTNRGVTALVLLGRGVMRFHPTPQVEQAQVRIFAGNETLESPFEAAFVRVGTLAGHAEISSLMPRALVDQRDLRRAEEVFRVESAKTFSINLGDLAPGNWTTLPAASDIVAEVRTRRFGTLTYSRSEESEEDISVFDRARQKNIAVYSSARRLAERGRFDDEDANAVYDVVNYEIDLSFDPVRRWFDSRARMRLKIRAAAATQLTLRLADTLGVESVTSDEFGPLFSVRVSNQNTLLVNLPAPLRRDAQINLTIEYSGRVGAQAIEWETLPFTQREFAALQGTSDAPPPQGARPTVYLYGNRSYWYPRATVFDYATATIRIWVPAEFDCIATGEPTPESPTLDDIDPLGHRKLYVFNAGRPIRYLSFLVTAMTPIDRATVAFSDKQEDDGGSFRGPAMGGAVYNTLDLKVVSHPRAATKARSLPAQAVDIVQFFRSIVGDTPYSSLTVALVEGNAPGGHSPAYVATIRQPAQNVPRPFRNDPAAVDAYPEFFTAHEIAHQWWGQAVGWKTYHDQWLSEGFAQYFAALYTQKERGDEAFGIILRQMRRWALDESDQGPLSLGYRLGHVRDDGRVFRALLYDKGAAVLHMLRRLIGDEAFFLGVRRFYASWRFQKAGTDDLRHAMEAEAGRSLERFFEQWVYGARLPQLKFAYRVENTPAPGSGREVILRVDQTGDLFEVPVTVQLQFAEGPPTEVIIPVVERTTEVRVPLLSSLRRVDISRDDGTLADVQKN